MTGSIAVATAWLRHKLESRAGFGGPRAEKHMGIFLLRCGVRRVHFRIVRMHIQEMARKNKTVVNKS